MKRRAFLIAPLALAACGLRRGPPLRGSLQDEDALMRALVSMGDGVDVTEARAAATLAYAETYRLARAYQIVDPPLLHNTKVNAGRKPRGLCWHWAEDLERALNAQGYRTLRMHRAIANSDSVRIDHSTAIIAAAGAPWHSGIVLDPWRDAGELFWGPVRSDSYAWQEREVVMRRYGRIRYVNQGAT